MKRLDLKVGYACSNDCLFCAVAEKRKRGSKTTAELKRDLELGRGKKADEVVFTGGEPTIRVDLAELIEYARKIGFAGIQIQSNGRSFSRMDFCERLIVAGATEFAPSLHGPNAAVHDSLTRRSGSFEETVQGIRNLVQLKQTVLTNSVVTKQNYRLLPELTLLLVSLGVQQAQLAFVHPMANAWKNFEKVVPGFADAMPYIYQSIEIAKQASLPFMIESVPYCLMQGYEKFVSEQYIPETEIRELNSVVLHFSTVRKTSAKAKAEKCKQCRYFPICEGPWKEYPAKRGFSEFRPVEGKKIKSFDELYC